MGDRVSIRFVKGDSKSPYLFSHWGGREFAQAAESYANNLAVEMAEIENDPKKGIFVSAGPLSRLEPETVMVDFISRAVGGGKMVPSDYYICSEESDGDNSDNGNFDIDLDVIQSRVERLLKVRKDGTKK